MYALSLSRTIPTATVDVQVLMAGQNVPIRRVIFGTTLNPRKVFRESPKVIPSQHIISLLERPSWSVRSMLPDSKSTESRQITKEQLHHLLKLSALPLPTTEQEEQRMLNTLESQIHFVKEVQQVDTNGVEPLVAIRDETAEAIGEQMITLDTLRPYLDKEKKVGQNGTIRRQKPTEMIRDSGWSPFEMGEGKETRKKGKFFFVKK